MNKFAQKLVAALNAADIKWRDYSGRGMYGVSCVGVSCGRAHTEGEVLEAVRNVPRALTPNRDSLGMGTILYWPSAVLAQTDEGNE